MQQSSSKFKATLHSYQQEILTDANRMGYENQSGVLLNLEMGMGKTYIALAWMVGIVNKQEGKNFLIVTPKSTVHSVWTAKIKELTSLKYEVFTAEFNDEVKRRRLGGANNILIITYEMMVNQIEYLSSREFDGIVLDESHRIKNPVTSFSESIMKLQSKRRLLLSATPLENNLMELYSQLNFLAPNKLDKKIFEWNQSIENLSNDRVGEIIKSISPYMISIRRDSVFDQYCNLPIEQNIYRLGPDSDLIDSKTLNTMYDLLFRDDEINSTSIVSKMVELNRRKVEPVVSLISKIRESYPEDKIVLFSNYTKSLKQLRYFLSKESIHNLNSIFYDGSLTLSERVKILNQFQSCNIPILLASKMATSLGIDLTCANHIIFIDSWWNPQVRNQAIARCWRPGQKKKVFVYSLHASESIEDSLLKTQRNKETLFNKIFFNGCCSSIEDKVTLWIDHPYSYNSRPTEKKDTLTIVNKFQLENAPQILCMFTDQNGQVQGRRRVLVKRTSKQLPNLSQFS